MLQRSGPVAARRLWRVLRQRVDFRWLAGALEGPLGFPNLCNCKSSSLNVALVIL